MNEKAAPSNPRKRSTLRRTLVIALKTVVWTAMAGLLAVLALAMCSANMLKPDRLTKVANYAANKLLDADVKLGRVELSLKGSFPFLRLDVDSLTILSRPIMRLDSALRSQLPSYADTLAEVAHFHGGINLPQLGLNRFHLSDVVVEGLRVNVVTVDSTLSNYLIYSSSDTTASESNAPLPAVRLNRFSILTPKPIRYFNLATGQEFEIALSSMSFVGEKAPTYSLKIGGDVASPMLGRYNLENVNFGLTGDMGWEPERPERLVVQNFNLAAQFIKARVNAAINFGHDIVVEEFNMDLGSMTVADMATVVPDSLATAWGLGPKLKTDLAFTFKAESTAPFNLNTDSIPHARMELEVQPGKLRYGPVNLTRVSGTLRADLAGNDLDSAAFTLVDVRLQGPATALTINGTVSSVISDPYFDATIKGRTNTTNLPPKLREMARGFIKGDINADIVLKGRASMFSTENLHKLQIMGDLDADGFYYLAADTSLMFNVNHACLKFGANNRMKRGERWIDSLLTAKLTVDTAEILSGGISMRLGQVQVGLGALNAGKQSDTTLVIPMGGRMEVGTFRLLSLSDSIIFNLRNANGKIGIRRYKGDAHRPIFNVDLDLARMSVGSPETRFMVGQAHLNGSAFMRENKREKAVRKTADSIHQVYPDLPLDSVYSYAMEKHRRKPGGKPRVHAELTDADTEVIDWGTSSSLRKLLLRWKIQGTLTAKRAGLFTPYFPLRNRIRDFNISFNNDSLLLQNVRYTAGRSDFVMSGRISNLARSLTSRTMRSRLKLNFDIISDTIDINQLAGTTFRGSAYAARVAADGVRSSEAGRLDADNLDADYPVATVDTTGSGPFLIPTNIDARINVKAANILYADLLLHDFTGEVLAYDGSVNLQNLKASSDVGSIALSALYSAPKATDMHFGFGLNVDGFHMGKFMHLVPALDSIMPLMNDISGIINADIAATCQIDTAMNFVLPTLDAAIRVSGDSLELIDKETYRTIGKWLRFKDRHSNIIKHMTVEMTIHDNLMQLYPFIFDVDRYTLGIQGHNDLALNFDYHIAVLKSPLPFKFGINIKGTPEHYKIRPGKAKFNEKTVTEQVAIVDTARVNLVRQIQNVFKRGVRDSDFGKLKISSVPLPQTPLEAADTLSHADSLLFIREGILPSSTLPNH